MSRGTEAAGKAWLPCHAAIEFIELAAVDAVEMMMMLFARDFIPGRVTGYLNRSQPAILE